MTDKGAIKFYKIRYKNKKILLRYCNYKNFKWSCIKISGYIILYINNDYSPQNKSKILHKAIREVF